MKHAKRILSILLACLLLMAAVPFAVSAAGTQDDPIDAATTWFGYGVDTYLLNPTIAAGSDGTWYTLTADKAGVLVLEHSYKDVDYTITITLNGQTYKGGCVDGEPYNRPIVTAPIAVGDVATIQIVTKDKAAGFVYASMNVLADDSDDPVKVKSNGLTVVVGAGKTLYFQDDSLNAIYATKGLLVSGDVASTTFYTVTKNAESGTATKKAFTDSDADGVIEVAALGGSLGSAGAPPVKPAWAIENQSAADQTYTLTIVDAAHECVYDDEADLDCNSCGALREAACAHVYDHDFDANCNTCNAQREVTLPLSMAGNSVSADVSGLAWLIEAKVDGLEVDNTTAIYDNATVNGYKLITMGAVVSNKGPVSLDDVDNASVLNVQATYIYDTNEDAGTVTYAIRAIKIPDECKDRDIDILTYFVFEDEAGVQHTLYCNSNSATYNQFA